MRKRKPEAEKKKPGLPPRRPFYNRIGFHISNEIHQQMKNIAKMRKVFLEDLYQEAMSNFLEFRSSNPIGYQYIRPPVQSLARRVTIEMEEPLWQAIQHAAVDDKRRIADLFETAVGLYLTKQTNSISS